MFIRRMMSFDYSALITFSRIYAVGLSALAFYLFYKPAGGFAFVIIALLMALLSSALPRVENRLRFLVVTALLMSVALVGCCVLIYTEFYFLSFIFLFCLIGYAIPPIRASAAAAMMLAVIFSSYQTGWHAGWNLAIGVLVSLVIVLLVNLVFTPTVRSIMRSGVVGYARGLRSYYRNFILSETGETPSAGRREKEIHRIAARAGKVESLLRPDNYSLPGNVTLARDLSALLVRLSLVANDLFFIRCYPRTRGRFAALVPSAAPVLQEIDRTFAGIIASLREGRSFRGTGDAALPERWRDEIGRLRELSLPERKQCRKFVDGIEALERDLDELGEAVYQIAG